MLAPIPWERYSGEVVEGILATYICRLHPHATRVRPSRGDRGIDLMEKNGDGTITVYQIKKFATNLEASHKRQIGKSLDSLLRYLEESEYDLREWHLVLPLDPTIENLEWLKGLVPESRFDMVWDGLTKIDGWAAQMPEVADYCLAANSGWAMELVRLHLEALDIEGDGGRDRVVQRLSAVQEILEKTTPYYRYGIRLAPNGMGDVEIEELVEAAGRQPGLLMTQMYERPGVGMVQIDVFARTAALAELNPIQGNVSFLPGDEGERRQVEDFVNYGVPIRSCPARIVETSGAFAFDMPEGDGDGVGKVSMFSHEDEPATPGLFLTTSEGAELALYRASRTSGEKGVQTVLSDKARVVSLTLRADFEGGVAGIPEITTVGIEGKDCSAVCDSLRFLDAAYECGEVSVMYDDKVLSFWTLHPKDDLARSIKALFELASAVESIGRRAHVRLPFPEIDSIERKAYGKILSKGALADGKCIISRWRDAHFKMADYEDVSLECPAIIKWLSPERITITGIECDLGYSESVIVAGSLQQDVGDESFRFLPRGEGEDVCITRLLPTRSAATGMVNQVYSMPYQEDVWIDMLRLAGYNQVEASR